MDEIATRISSWLSVGVLVLLAFGIYHRHRPSLHIPTMLACFAIDVGNVIYIEVRRGAVEKTISTAGTAGEWILKLHILVSVLSIVGYLVAVITGVRLLRKGRGRLAHRLNAVIFLSLRVTNYLTSFYV